MTDTQRDELLINISTQIMQMTRRLVNVEKKVSSVEKKYQ